MMGETGRMDEFYIKREGIFKNAFTFDVKNSS